MKLTSVLIAFTLLAVISISCSEQKEEITEKMEMKADKQLSEHSIGEAKSELVREGVIDVASIDENNDGKLFECPMDWNVLNDTHGDCPVCGMDMKEYSLEDIKTNLDKYGYEYK
jgi:hypothetical protein